MAIPFLADDGAEMGMTCDHLTCLLAIVFLLSIIGLDTPSRSQVLPTRRSIQKGVRPFRALAWMDDEVSDNLASPSISRPANDEDGRVFYVLNYGEKRIPILIETLAFIFACVVLGVSMLLNRWRSVPAWGLSSSEVIVFLLVHVRVSNLGHICSPPACLSRRRDR